MFNLRFIKGFISGVIVTLVTVLLPQLLSPTDVSIDTVTQVKPVPAHMLDSYGFTEDDVSYVDYDQDIAYVYVPTACVVTSGTEVYFSDKTPMYVKDVTATGFYLDIADRYIQAGVSGSPVWYDDRIIGYVSSLSCDNLLYCVWNT